MVDVGAVVRQTVLDTTAVYEVAGLEEDHAWLTVVSAPGLPPGASFRVTRRALAAMEPVPAAPPAPERRGPLGEVA